MAKQKRKKTTSVARQAHTAARQDQLWDSLFASLGRFEIVLLAGAVLLLMVLIYTIHEILSPFLILGAILFLLFPMRRFVIARTLMWLSITLVGIWFVDTLAPVLAPFVISLVFAYMLNPVVDLFAKWGLPRWVSALVLILLFLAGITLAIFFILPIAVTQLEGVLDSLSRVTDDFRNFFWNSKIMQLLERYGLSASDVRSSLQNQVTPKLQDILQALVKALGSLMSGLSSFITQIFYLILIPFLTFYFLTDFPTIAHRFRMLFPKNLRPRVAEYMEKADDLIGHYMRGALLVAVIQGILVAVFFSIFGIRYALLLGLLAAILDLVPYFGLIITMVFASAMAVFSDPPILPKIAFAIGWIGFLHILETVFLSPKILGSKVGVHPLLIILSLLVFMYFLGFVGLLIAVPTTALIILFVRDWENRRHGGPHAADSSFTSSE